MKSARNQTALDTPPSLQGSQPLPPQARVLVVDDEFMIGRGISEMLSYLNFRCEYLQNGREAIPYLADHPEIDIVLLDINLGMGISGIELLPLLREKNKYAQYIMFTSEDKLEVGVECMRKGAYDYMTKPFDEQLFMTKVPGALERKKMLQLNDLYLGILFHDIKNPVQGIMGGLELLRMSLPQESEDETRKCALAQTDSSIKQILMMINNIVAVSKFENNSLSARRELFVLQREVSAALEPFSFRGIEDNAPKVTISFPDDNDIVIENDRDLFCRTLTNIVSNAVRYSSEGVPVKVAFEKEAGEIVHVTVTNTGSYIEDTAREAIFNKFSSVELPASQSGFKNFGLGLTFSKMAVDAMGGRIWIECDKTLPSTTFHFTLKNFKQEQILAS
ncbi:MAG: hybrid sensor histidine kinase/response regulator [Chitinispirillaceae bacterium]|nr:hybrid sensor histidine kinase/response regulator [Chitinispirillaceae bacterium]